MKRIFPAIFILISLSLVGLIFFQFLWLQSAREVKEKELRGNVIRATAEAASRLVQDNSMLPVPKRNDNLFPPERMPREFIRPSVIQRYSKEEISDIIKKSLHNNYLDNLHFEFAITDVSFSGDEISSDDFYKYYVDSTNNIRQFIQLVAPSGSMFENLTREEYLVIIVPNEKTVILKGITWFIVGAILFTLIITTAFFLTIKTILKQKKLSEIKNDFINNMTHEFKTPLATISLAVDALKNEKVAADQTKIDYFTGVIKEENKRMNKQVETILQAALLDRQSTVLNFKKRSAHELITVALNNIALQVADKDGRLITDLKATNDCILADEVHFINIINNLLENAVKYSGSNPIIKLCTSNAGKHLKIKVEDNGVGMNKETVSRIFEKFYRAHTGNIHNVKGFGLGLTYVKTMVTAHNGTIKVDSVPNKGSIFTLILPLA